MIVEIGVAETIVPVVTERPVDGDHVYVIAPLAVKLTLLPEQVELFPLTETVGKAFTETETVLVEVHPLLPVIV